MLFTDSRYAEQAGAQSPHFEIIQTKAGLGWLLDSLKETGARKIGFESDNMTVASYNRALDAIKEEEDLAGTSLIATSGIADWAALPEGRQGNWPSFRGPLTPRTGPWRPSVPQLRRA